MKQLNILPLVEGTSKAIPLTSAVENVRWENGKPTSEKESVRYTVAIPGLSDTCQVCFAYNPGLADILNTKLLIGTPINLESLGEVDAITVTVYNGGLTVRYSMCTTDSISKQEKKGGA